MVKKLAAWLGGLVAFLSLLTTAVGVFVLERENDDLYREIGRLDRKMDSLEDDAQDKEIACKVLEASISSARYKHNYCKD